MKLFLYINSLLVLLLLQNFATASEYLSKEELSKIFHSLEKFEGAKKEIEIFQRTYSEYYPKLSKVFISGPYFFSLKPDYTKLTTEQKIEKIWESGGLAQLHSTAKVKLNKFILNNKDKYESLVTKDLKSANLISIERAIKFIGAFSMQKFSKDVIKTFRKYPELRNRTAYTIRDLDLYVAIDDLISYPESPVVYFEQMRMLQKKKKAKQSLLELLSSDNPEVRWKAAYSLAESGDGELAPYCSILFKDADPRVREQAVNIAYFLTGDAYQKIYSQYLAMLKDENVNVRLNTAISLAQKKDPACAKTLLKLLKNNVLDESSHSNVVQAVQNLTGTYFGYYIGSDAWKPNTENNKRAIELFEKWIKNQK